MAENILLMDPEAWDDSALIDSWDQALAEYKRYHSIHAKGEKVEDVLKQDELDRLRIDMGVQVTPKQRTQPAVDTETEPVNEIENDVSMTEHDQQQEQVLQQGTHHEPKTSDSAAAQDSRVNMPEALLSTVQDEHLKNLMMSWYYAGYYTGLVEGQRKAQEAPTTQITKP